MLLLLIIKNEEFQKTKDYEGAMADLEKAIEIETDDNHLIEYKKSLKEFNERMQNIVNDMTSDKSIENFVKGIKNDMEKEIERLKKNNDQTKY